MTASVLAKALCLAFAALFVGALIILAAPLLRAARNRDRRSS